MSASYPAVFMDRDGVLNNTVMRGGQQFPPADLRELVVAPGVEEGCRALREAGYVLVGITNQPDVARGLTDRRTVEEINANLVERLGMSEFRVCYHDDGDDCGCRKPKPGLILQAAQEQRIDVAASYMVGDRWKDIEAGRRAGCRTVLIRNQFAEPGRCAPTFTVGSFPEAVAAILADARTAAQGESLR